MSLPDSVVLNVHLDPRHAYFEVPANLVNELGLGVSRYSYVSPDNTLYYLECDFDAEKLINALAHNNISFEFNEINHEDLAFFRKYRSAGYVH